ncbi:MAG TPA: O-methyltransferase, partial [Spirochaetia bacterium]|nr:O-methyltransferase [Spirochaetia bacterium]
HVAPNQGRLLALLVMAIKARRVLEIGTLAGYSTLWMAGALPPDGRLISLEANAAYAAVAQKNIKRAGLHGIVEVRVGPALESLADLEMEPSLLFDFVFIDADKKNNAEYAQWALKLTHPGSLIVMDNVVRDGAVVRGTRADESVRGVRKAMDVLAASRGLMASAIQTVGVKGYDGFAIALVTG